jgi:uroporphyrinogen decarboxylase
LAYNIQLVDEMLNRVGDKIQVIKVSDDIGSQDNLLISPALYRRMIKPRQAKFFAEIHAKTSARLLYHSCGAVSRLIDDWIEIGVDILNPIQVSARGMDTAALGNKYADQVAFWGAVDNQGAISLGTPAAVRADVRKRMRDLGRQGGYVIASSHNLAADTPVENILALYQAERSLCG